LKGKAPVDGFDDGVRDSRELAGCQVRRERRSNWSDGRLANNRSGDCTLVAILSFSLIA
jgi:hypothetical protein